MVDRGVRARKHQGHRILDRRKVFGMRNFRDQTDRHITEERDRRRSEHFGTTIKLGATPRLVRKRNYDEVQNKDRQPVQRPLSRRIFKTLHELS